MPIQVEAYLTGGIATGTFARAGQLRDFLETSSELPLAGATWQALDGVSAGPSGDVTIASDDCLIVVSDDDPFIAAHAAWHSIDLEMGPYTLSGELPTLPGFDPGRALTRPSGEFVMLKDVRVGLLTVPETTIEVHHALVNRYGVDRVSADLMLGFFFPGAAMDDPQAASAPSA
jgi:hypothetical protein